MSPFPILLRQQRGDLLLQILSSKLTPYRASRYRIVRPSRRLTSSKSTSTSSSTSAAATSPSPFQSPLQWYASKLDTHPLLTKGITSGMIAGSGDILCQYLSNNSQSSGPTDENDSPTNTHQTFNWKRTLRFTILGSFLIAPTVHVWYGALMTRIPGTSASVVAKRLFFDQGCFAPVFTSVFISCLTVLEHLFPDGNSSLILETKQQNEHGNNRKEENSNLSKHIQNRLVNDVPDAILVGWSMWVPSMAFMFAFISSKYQVLFSNGVGFVWNSYLSWRTHEGEEQNDGH
eukprot:CAMPEP_0171350988 /NCGR_PEP_ID=MMETSP0878-20121228/37832_1 /TAXON_ID=67004 /ORGANISM="Thalassiosira weissflogii, Strain CCMP1336" /LENGTH=288 /DNA_ID=CAMNT_0011856091 /DNA_START=10 /DNA_END=876 /DNA_ORIENTATION=-